MNEFVDDDFLTYTIAIVVFFVGFHLNKRIALLRRFNIPEPVTGGLLAATLLLLVFAVTDTSVTYELETRDRLLVYFFVTIGLNARVSDLIAGGRPLLTLIVLTLTCIVPTAMLILPLVAAFLVDIMNAFVIRFAWSF